MDGHRDRPEEPPAVGLGDQRVGIARGEEPELGADDGLVGRVAQLTEETNQAAAASASTAGRTRKRGVSMELERELAGPGCGNRSVSFALDTPTVLLPQGPQSGVL